MCLFYFCFGDLWNKVKAFVFGVTVWRRECVFGNTFIMCLLTKHPWSISRCKMLHINTLDLRLTIHTLRQLRSFSFRSFFVAHSKWLKQLFKWFTVWNLPLSDFQSCCTCAAAATDFPFWCLPMCCWFHVTSWTTISFTSFLYKHSWISVYPL